MPTSTRPLRIGNCSGFYGDRLAAAREMLTGGPLDFLTGDYLAELTMLILWKSRQKDAAKGYAVTFLRQMEDVLGLAIDRRVKIVTDAGGLNPAGLAAELRTLCQTLGIQANIAHIEGDDLLPRLPALQAAGHELRHLDTGQPLAELGATPLSANAYLGAWGIVEALARGADVVVCPRVTDASVVVGPAAWHFGWQRDDWDRLASAVVVGHVLECGTQCTGGNYAFFQEVPGLEHPGFPLAEMHADGTAIITKHPGAGGLVSVGTVTAQLLYEIDGPRYFNPDCVARFDTIRLEQTGADRVRISGVRGEPAPPTVKVCINYLGGFRNSMTLVLTGLDIEAKAQLARSTLQSALGDAKQFDALDFDLMRFDKPDAPTNNEASALLRITAKGKDEKRIGRAFSNAVVEMVLASYPGFYCTTPPGDASPYGVYWPSLVPQEIPQQVVVLADGTRVAIPPSRSGLALTEPPSEPPPSRSGLALTEPPSKLPSGQALTYKAGPTKRVPLGAVFGARSGDKGGNANVGLWARDDAAYAWLAQFLTVERFKCLVPEAAALTVHRHDFPNLRALNFVVVGLLGEGVSSSTRFDAQAKSLGEYLRSRVVEMPEEVMGGARDGSS
jgi:Acyclic terpene utilisation family protein AtuA